MRHLTFIAPHGYERFKKLLLNIDQSTTECLNVSDLLPYDSELIPPEFLLDDYHPANDEYLQQQELVQKKLVHISSNMKPKHVQVVKMHFAGSKNTEIAEALELAEGTVSTIINRDDAKRLKALLAFYQMGVEGPNEAQRRNMLWRMALTNEEERPTVSKECIAELNRMDNAAKQIELGKQGNNNTVNIIINNETLPRGALDG